MADKKSLSEFRAAVDALYPALVAYARVTPLIRSEYYSQKFGANVFLKLETLQHTGSFKLRGALAKALSLPKKDLSRGFIAASAGNHGLGVCFAARTFSTHAKIFLPQTTPDFKIRKIVELGGEPVVIGADWDASNEAALKEAQKSKATYFHPFDDEAVMQGQATIAHEFFSALPQTDVILCSVGGGGLISGLARYTKSVRPSARLFGVETSGADSMARSLAAGKLQTLTEATSVAESICVRRPADSAFNYVRALVEDVAVVDDAEALHAQTDLLQQEKLLTEPAASCCIAALEKGLIPKIRGKNVVIVLCGANYPMDKLATSIRQDATVAYKSNKSALLQQINSFGVKTKAGDAAFEKFFREIKRRELDGYAYGEALASLEILARKHFHQMPKFFTLNSFRVLEDRRQAAENHETLSEAVVRMQAGGTAHLAAAESLRGPVSALATAMHQILDPIYPTLKNVNLTDYRVRILTPHEGIDAVTRVMIESRDEINAVWITLGISEDIINASYQALVESYQYKLLKDRVAPRP